MALGEELREDRHPSLTCGEMTQLSRVFSEIYRRSTQSIHAHMWKQMSFGSAQAKPDGEPRIFPLMQICDYIH